MRNIFGDNNCNSANYRKEESAYLYKTAELCASDTRPVKMIIRLLECEVCICASIIKYICDDQQMSMYTDKPASYWNRFNKENPIEVTGILIEDSFIFPRQLIVRDAYEIYDEDSINDMMMEDIKLGFSFKENVMKPIYKMQAADFSRNLEKHLYFMVIVGAIAFSTAKCICDTLSLGKGWKKMWPNGDGTVSVYISGLNEEVIRIGTLLNWIIDQLRNDVIAREKIEHCNRIESLIQYLNKFNIPYSYDYCYGNLVNCDNVIFTKEHIYYREENEDDIPSLFAISYDGKFNDKIKLLPWEGELIVEGIEQEIFYSEKTRCIYCNSPYYNNFYRIYTDTKKVETESGTIVAITGAGREWYTKDDGLYYKEQGNEVYVCEFEEDKVYEVIDNNNIIVEPKPGIDNMFEPYKYNVEKKQYSISKARTNGFLWKMLVRELYINKKMVLESNNITLIMFIEQSIKGPEEFNIFEITTRLKELTSEYYSKDKVKKLLDYINDMIFKEKLVEESNIDLYNRLVNVVKAN